MKGSIYFGLPDILMIVFFKVTFDYMNVANNIKLKSFFQHNVAAL